MIINAIKCKKCGDTIYSRCRHDMRWCTCKSCAIDGGFDYIKICGNVENIESKHIDIGNITELELYQDWNYDTNKYGLIKDECNN